jgi:hypothetical protein
MIPPFNENGYLPPGIHKASLDEIAERFSWQSEVRRAQMESLRWLMDMVKRLNTRRLVLNGSFVTDEVEPNDVDCVLLFDSNALQDADADTELRAGLPFLEIDVVDQDNFDFLVDIVFVSDRDRVPKGMIEVIL